MTGPAIFERKLLVDEKGAKRRVGASVGTTRVVPVDSGPMEVEVRPRPCRRRRQKGPRRRSTTPGDRSDGHLRPRSHSLDDQLAWIGLDVGAHPAIVAVIDGDVVGFGSLSPNRSRPAYATSVKDSGLRARRPPGPGLRPGSCSPSWSGWRRHGFHTVMARIVTATRRSFALHRACGLGLVGVERELGRELGRWLDVALIQQLL